MKLFNLPFCLKQTLINLLGYRKVLYKQKSFHSEKSRTLVTCNKVIFIFLQVRVNKGYKASLTLI